MVAWWYFKKIQTNTMKYKTKPTEPKEPQNRLLIKIFLLFICTSVTIVTWTTLNIWIQEKSFAVNFQQIDEKTNKFLTNCINSC